MMMEAAFISMLDQMWAEMDGKREELSETMLKIEEARNHGVPVGVAAVRIMAQCVAVVAAEVDNRRELRKREESTDD